MARYTFSNNPDGDLLADLTEAGTLLSLATGHGARFPAPAAGESFPLTVQDMAGMEIMLCTARTGDVLTVVRAQEGTAARAFVAGAVVQARITAAVLGQMVQDSGDTMTGALHLPAGNPALATEAAHKGYVDGRFAAVPPAGISQADADTRYVNVTGDSMTGALTLPGDPVNPLEAATRQFVLANAAAGGIGEAPSDGAAYGRRNAAWDKTVRTAGDTITGALAFGSVTREMLNLYSNTYSMGVQSGTAYTRVPTNGRIAFYGGGVYSSIANDPGVGGVNVMTLRAGSEITAYVPVVLPGAPTLDLHAATKLYVDTKAPLATELLSGTAEIATLAEVQAGLDHQRIVTPATLSNSLQGVPQPTIAWDAATLALPAGWTFVRPDPGTYVDAAGITQTAAINVPRFTHDRVTRAFLGLLVEENSNNLLLNSAVLATQSVTTTAVAHTLSFVGTGTVALSGAHTGSLAGTGAAVRKTLSFTPTAGTLTVTVTGDVREGQIETKDFATSWIPTTGAAGVRGREYFNINTTLNNGTMTYALRLAPYREGSALGAANAAYLFQWGMTYAANNSARLTKNANGTLNFIRQPTGAADYNFNSVGVLVPDQFTTIVHGYGGGTAVAVKDTEAPIEVACGATGWPTGPVDALRFGQATVVGLTYVLSSIRIWNGTRLTNAQAAQVASNTGALGAMTRYVDSQVATRVAKAGDTMTGMLTLPASNPTLSEHAVRKAYADSLLLAKMIPLSAVWGGTNYDPVSEAQFITVALPARTRYVVTWVTSTAANGGSVQATMTIKASLLNAVGAVVGTPLGFLMRSVGGTYASTTFPVLFDCGVGAVGASTAWTVKISAVRDQPFNMLEQYLAGFAMCEP